MNKKNKYFREIPSIDEILNHSEVSNKLKSLNKNSSVRVVNTSIEEIKESILKGLDDIGITLRFEEDIKRYEINDTKIN